MYEGQFLEVDDDSKEEQVNDISPKDRLFSVAVDKIAIQKMVLEYLSEKGYYKAYKALQRETNLEIGVAPLLKERECIRILCENGEYLKVIEKISSVCLFIFEDHSALYFSILAQDILEDLCIRKNSEANILQRIEKEITPLIQSNPSLLKKLEDLVGDIVFGSVDSEKILLEREGIFHQINRTILRIADYEEKESLRQLISKAEELSKTPKFMSLSRECAIIEGIFNQISLGPIESTLPSMQ
ncbi:glucose-induced degradation protein 8 [Nematocida sp. AWRm80]|nr:glucose-induced degradation protein 8 [Nematocida sp. AWRm80]